MVRASVSFVFFSKQTILWLNRASYYLIYISNAFLSHIIFSLFLFLFMFAVYSLCANCPISTIAHESNKVLFFCTMMTMDGAAAIPLLQEYVPLKLWMLRKRAENMCARVYGHHLAVFAATWRRIHYSTHFLALYIMLIIIARYMYLFMRTRSFYWHYPVSRADTPKTRAIFDDNDVCSGLAHI